MDLELVPIPFDSYGRAGAVAAASAALRDAGLAYRLAERQKVVVAAAPELPAPTAVRSPGAGLLNEPALLALADGIDAAVRRAWDAGRRPLLYGGDCAALLGAVPAARDAFGEVGLVHIDGHEDAYPLETSPDGQAADSEIALLLGLAGAAAPPALQRRLPALAPEALAILGARLVDDGRPTLEGRVAVTRDDELMAGDAEAIGRAATARAGDGGRGFWLHVDLDVLCTADFPAHDFPEPGGIEWARLERLTELALATGQCVGWSVVIYNPDLDPGRHVARRVVDYVAGCAAGWR